MRFRINAIIYADPSPETVVFDSILEPISRSVNVEESLHVWWCSPIEKELAYIRQMGSSLRKKSKIAGRLGIGGDTIKSPCFAFNWRVCLSQRTQRKLDDDFPELTDALLNVVFPHYQRPLPSYSIVQFAPDKTQMDSKFLVKRRTEIETEKFQGEHCNFSLCDVELYPFDLKEAQLMGAPTHQARASFAGPLAY